MSVVKPYNASRDDGRSPLSDEGTSNNEEATMYFPNHHRRYDTRFEKLADNVLRIAVAVRKESQPRCARRLLPMMQEPASG